MLKLLNGKKESVIASTLNESMIRIAAQNKIPWGYLCEQGNCARCRTFVVEGNSFLNQPTQAEQVRLTEKELEKGFRLGCQIKQTLNGDVVLRFSPYS